MTSNFFRGLFVTYPLVNSCLDVILVGCSRRQLDRHGPAARCKSTTIRCSQEFISGGFLPSGLESGRSSFSSYRWPRPPLGIVVRCKSSPAEILLLGILQKLISPGGLGHHPHEPPVSIFRCLLIGSRFRFCLRSCSLAQFGPCDRHVCRGFVHVEQYLSFQCLVWFVKLSLAFDVCFDPVVILIPVPVAPFASGGSRGRHCFARCA